jgi:peptide/nickel transport system substrate-binding protein
LSFPTRTNYAVNRDAINQALFQGTLKLLRGQHIGPDADGYDATIPDYAYDPAKAKSLLADAGYKDGFTIKLDTTLGMAVKDKEIAEAIAADLAKVGIKVELILNERAVYLDKLFNAKMEPFWSISLNYYPGNINNPMMTWTCSVNHGSHCDPAYDALFAKWNTSTDPAEWRQLTSQALRYVNENALALFLWQVPGIYAVSPRIKGWEINSDYTMNLVKTTAGPK